jgi:HEAT repeat protein
MSAIFLLFLALAQDDPVRLVERFASDSAVERDEATRKLLKLGEAAVPALEAATRSKDPETSARSARLLKILANRKLLTPRIRGAFPDLVESIDNRDVEVWTRLFLEAARTEGNVQVYRNLQKEDLLPLVDLAVQGIRSLEDKQAFCEAVHMWKFAEIAAKTGPLLKGENDQNLWYSVPALLAMTDPKSAVASLELVLTDPSPKVRARAVDLLPNRDQAALPAACGPWGSFA